MTSRDDRRVELLVERVLWGLSDDDARVLAPLLDEAPGEAEEFDRATAVATAALLPPAEIPPLELLTKLQADARRHFGLQVDGPESNAQNRRWSPWLATAAAVLLTSLVWWWSARPISAGRLRADLVSLPGTVCIAWQPGSSPLRSEVSGDVVWHPDRQQGVICLRGLPKNDPSVRRFQLWVVDGDRDNPEPVDGGVFDVQAAETVVAFETSLPVTDARAFVVTVERPEGEVVSRQEHVVASANRD